MKKLLSMLLVLSMLLALWGCGASQAEPAASDGETVTESQPVTAAPAEDPKVFRVGFAAAPYEMFDTNGMFIKENSPFAHTVIATLSNYSHGYFPSDFTFETGSYEVDTTRFVRGTAERLADQYIAMLTEQFNNR